MDIIKKLSSVEDVKQAFTDLGVSSKRIEGLDKKFVAIPDNFKIVGITARKIDIGGTERVVPEFSILDGKAPGSIPIGQLFASHCGDGTTASQIKKEGDFKDRWLVSNNKKVNEFAQTMSEAEFITYCYNKSFKAQPAKDFKVYSGFVKQPDGSNKIQFHNSQEEAIAAVGSKSYRPVEIA